MNSNHTWNTHLVFISFSWKHLWKLKAPPKVCHFIWSCLNNYIAIFDNLATENILRDPVCRQCGEAKETLVLHLFFNCHFARCFWLSLPVVTSGRFGKNCSQILSLNLALTSMQLAFGLFGWLATGNFMRTVNLLYTEACKAVSLLNAFSISNSIDSDDIVSNCDLQQKEKLLKTINSFLDNNLLCIFTVGSWVESLNIGGSKDKQPIFTAHSGTLSCLSTYQCEALAVRDALKAALNLGWRRIAVFCDSLIFVEAANSRKSLTAFYLDKSE